MTLDTERPGRLPVNWSCPWRNPCPVYGTLPAATFSRSFFSSVALLQLKPLLSSAPLGPLYEHIPSMGWGENIRWNPWVAAHFSPLSLSDLACLVVLAHYCSSHGLAATKLISNIYAMTLEKPETVSCRFAYLGLRRKLSLTNSTHRTCPTRCHLRTRTGIYQCVCQRNMSKQHFEGIYETASWECCILGLEDSQYLLMSWKLWESLQ